MNILPIAMVFAVLLATMASRLPRDTEDNYIDGSEDDDLSLASDEEDLENESCTAKDGKEGLCVPQSYCNEDHTIMPGGVIDPSEFRQMPSRPCRELLYWCCTNDSIVQPPNIRTVNTGSCQPPDGDICPWAVSLYKVADMEQPEVRLFCMGVLIGSRVILTAATCMKSGLQHMVFARVPSSTEPNRDYIVSLRKPHRAYNSGSHANDFALFVLEEDVKWRTAKAHGACLSFDKLEGNCMTLGFDSDDQITSTELTVTKAGCTSLGGKATQDRACGTKVVYEQCIATTGAPVVCETKPGVAAVVGITRSSCINNQVLLGSLAHVSTWITDELNAMKVTQDIYLQN